MAMGGEAKTDIVERLLLKKTLETVEDVHVLFADAADEIDRLRDALREYVATVVCEEGVAFIDRMPTAELRLLVESVSKEDK